MQIYKQSWLTLSALQLSGAMSLPVMLVGFYLGQHYSLYASILAIMLGNLILLSLALFYQKSIYQKKWATIEFAQALFGKNGSTISAMGLMMSLVGWSAIQINLITTVLGGSLLIPPLLVALIYGLSRNDLKRFATANYVILAMVIGCLSYFLLTMSHPKILQPVMQAESFRLGLLLVLTTGCGALFDLPTFYRHAATRKDLILSLMLVFMFILPLIEIVGIYVSTQCTFVGDQSTWIGQFVHTFNFSSLLFLIMSGMLGACLNLYSASVVMNKTFSISYKKSLFVLGLASGLLSLVNLENHFLTILEIINLNTEIVFVLIMVYLAIKGSTMLIPTIQQRKIHQCLFLLILSYLLLTKIYPIDLFHDLFIDTAFLGVLCMTIYYSYSAIINKVEVQNENA